MEGLFDFLFSNPFLVILLIGGLISFFKRNTGEQEPEKAPTRPQPKPVESRTDTKKEKAQLPRQKPQPVNEVQTVEVYRQQQLNSLKDKLEERNDRLSDKKSQVSNHIRKRQTENVASDHKEEPFKRRFKGNVTRTGLINSVIMSEVLGPPRAMKPYDVRPFKRKY